MSKALTAAVFLMIASLLRGPSLFGQQASESGGGLEDLVGVVVRVETLEGSTFQGRLLKVQEDRIELLNADGLILQVSRPEIKAVLEIKPERGGNVYFQDASSNRLIVMPTGFGMEEREFHIADLEIVGVTASYGVSSNFSLWGGVSIPGFLINARFSFSLADDFIGASVGSFAGISWSTGTVLAIPYVIASFGSENQNLTLGAGSLLAFLSYAPSDSFMVGAVVGVLGGKLPLSSTTALITENWIVLPLPSIGGVLVFPALVFRIASNRLSWDIGATYPFGVGGGVMYNIIGFPIPLLTLTYRIS